MKKEIEKLLEKWACGHQWKFYAEMDLFVKGDNRAIPIPIQIRHTLICKKCGKIKKIVL